MLVIPILLDRLNLLHNFETIEVSQRVDVNILSKHFFTLTVQVSQQFFAVNMARIEYTCKNRLSAYRMFSMYIKKEME